MKFVSAAWISGSWMKFRKAWAAFGSGASAMMTQVSSQKSVPSDGTVYAMSAVSGFARSSTRGPVQPRQRTASSEASLSWYVSESRARMCGARSMRIFRASSRSAFSVLLSDLPIILSGMTKTSPMESTKTALPLYLPLMRSLNSFQEVTGSFTTLLRYRMPVVPKSLGSWYSFLGSHARPMNAGLMYFWLGTRLQSIFWM